MVPLRLHLSNFLSYGSDSAPIEFDGIHVACLCGPNGHGKSALLDAMTWALWGQARSNVADELIRLGGDSMFVELEFRLEDRCYRVVRRRTRGRSGQSDLQFHGQTADGTWHALTAQGVRGTEEQIVRTLRMDYETFINSAFLLQGRADEFSRKTPGDRKKILGEILNLGLYDQLCDLARLRLKDAVMKVRALEAEIENLLREHGRLPNLREEAGRLEGECGRARTAVLEARSEHAEARLEQQRLEEHRRRLEEIGRRLQESDAALKQLRLRRAAVEQRVVEVRALLTRAVEIRERHQRRSALQEEARRFSETLLALNRLAEERAAVVRRIDVERGRLERTLELAKHTTRGLREQAARREQSEREAAALAEQAGTRERLSEERLAAQQRVQELQQAVAEAQAEQRRLAEELKSADERFHLLKEADAACPVCEGPLTPEKRRELGFRMRDQRSELHRQQSAAAGHEAEGNREREQERKRLAGVEAALRTADQASARLEGLRRTLNEQREAAAKLPEEEQRIAGLEKQVHEQSFAPDDFRALAEVQARIAVLGCDAKRQAEVDAQLRDLDGAERDLLALEQAEKTLPEAEAEERGLVEEVGNREQSLAEERAAGAALERKLIRADAVAARVRNLEQRLNRAEAEEAAFQRQLGAAKEAVERCEQLGPRIEESRRERAAAAEDQLLYDELAKAFGRNGIPALIIENALPEIENEANALLARMSEGQLHVTLRTQKDLKSGGQAETLDIEISDGLGARKYELYSGGEAFRLNFALRIALSRLLARRAGARLETLVIDEGFGSQDQEGREQLVEAIRAVQNDFAMILVITHLEDLKGEFPTRLEVTKGPEGSRVMVS